MLICSVLLIMVTNSAICSRIEPIKHYPSVPTSGTLQHDLQEFLTLVPIDDIRNLTQHFYANDEMMRESYDYLRHDGHRFVLDKLAKLTILRKFASYLNDTGVNFAVLGQQVERIVLTDEETQSIVVDESEQDLGGMDGFFAEAITLIPQDVVLTLFFAKLEESNAFSSFFEKLSASDYENLAEDLKKSQGLQAIYFELMAHNIDILKWFTSLRTYFGY